MSRSKLRATKLVACLGLIAVIYFDGGLALADKKKRKRAPAVPKTMPAPEAAESEVKVILAQEDLPKALDWVQSQKATYEQRHVFFFDTKDNDLRKSGLILRLRRKQDDSYDSVVKIRKADIQDVPSLRGKSLKKLKCEMDLQIEQEDRKSCSVEVKTKKILPSMDSNNPAAFFDSDQERFIRHFFPSFRYGDLENKGRINSVIWDLEGNENTPISFEVWTLPNGTRIAEFSQRAPFKDADKATETLVKQVRAWNFKIDQKAQLKTDLAY